MSDPTAADRLPPDGPRIVHDRPISRSGCPEPSVIACARPGEERAPSDRLVEANLGFVVRIAREYRNLGLPFEDLLNEGNIGLIEAAHRFDPTHGTRFITYAVWWIRKAIRRALTRHSTNVYVPEYQLNKVRRLRTVRSSLSNTLGREADREEVSRELGLKVAKIDRILQLKTSEISLDEIVRRDGDKPLSDILVDRGSGDPEGRLIGCETRGLLARALRDLPPQAQIVIVNRFGLGGGPAFSLSQIGERLGVSRERARQIELTSKKRLRRMLEGQRGRAWASHHGGPLLGRYAL